MADKTLSPLGNDNAQVERVAKAIYGVQVKAARERVSAIAFDVKEMSRVLDVAISESDRAAAILLFAYAEDMIIEGIKRNVNGDVKGGFAALTAPNGLLSTAHHRITFLAALRWISPMTYKSIQTLRTIRNKFAHHVDCDAFDHTAIAGMVGSLPDLERPIAEATGAHFVGHRTLFLCRSVLLIQRLMHEIAVTPHAIAHHVSPKDVVGSYDEMPKSLTELALAAADIVLKLQTSVHDRADRAVLTADVAEVR